MSAVRVWTLFGFECRRTVFNPPLLSGSPTSAGFLVCFSGTENVFSSSLDSCSPRMT